MSTDLPSGSYDGQPLLYFKVGVLGSMPLDFPEAMAYEFDAKHVSSDGIRFEIMCEQIMGGIDPPRPINMRQIKAAMEQRSAAHLQESYDVVADIFCNTVKSRELPRTIARNSGALAVALSVHTPYAVAVERVRIWAEEDAFTVPVKYWDIHPVAAARAMMDHVERPAHEGIDYVINLDGTTDTDGLLNQVGEQLELRGLMD